MYDSYESINQQKMTPGVRNFSADGGNRLLAPIWQETFQCYRFDRSARRLVNDLHSVASTSDFIFNSTNRGVVLFTVHKCGSSKEYTDLGKRLENRQRWIFRLFRLSRDALTLKFIEKRRAIILTAEMAEMRCDAFIGNDKQRRITIRCDGISIRVL